MEYVNTIWTSIASDTNLNKLQKIQNASLRIATGCIKDTNINHLHQETKKITCKTAWINIKAKAQIPTHPLHSLITQNPKSRKHYSKN